ncbi:MAG: hypothetical protein DSM106950_21080 [Stigonema ocellatum SAG 48.90 = DSM 106950]|nr:hypothetical protein [Stigonema ocellatum SAG 48.90 = DSM 106950]
MKESIIKISKPIPKVQPQPSESEIQSNLTQTQELSSKEELTEPEPEPIDMAEPGLMRFASTDSHGWKVSDILREIRLDNFEMGGGD